MFHDLLQSINLHGKNKVHLTNFKVKVWIWLITNDYYSYFLYCDLSAVTTTVYSLFGICMSLKLVWVKI
jgi:hypothetical protein